MTAKIPLVVEEGQPASKTADMIATLRLLADIMEWQQATIDDFHAYAHRFGGTPGGDVYEFVIRDALRLRGTTLEKLREEWRR